MNFFDFLFFFEGRVSRRVLWRRCFLPFGVGTLIALYIQFVGESVDFGAGGPRAVDGGIVFYFFLIAWPVVAVSVKRLHDRNKSGSWMWVALVPVIGWVW